jgi:murein DD-endopeptidase MepM/ murein hydrolase activator NlpD
MASSLVHTLNAAVGRIFPERRVYVRSDARTRYWTLAPISQLGFTVFFAGLLGWSAFTSLAYVSHAVDGRTAENRLAATKEAHDTQLAALREQQRLLEDELNRSNERGDLVTAELSEKQSVLIDTVAKYQSAEVELEGLRGEFEDLVAFRREELDELNALNDEIVELRLSLAEAEDNSTAMSDTLFTFSQTMARVIAERDISTDRADELDIQVADLQTEITQWEGRQQQLLAQIEDAARVSLSSLDELFVNSDVDLEGILKQTKRDYSGRGGGPFVPLSDEEAAASPADEERVAALMTDLERVSLMRAAIDRLPFGQPTKGARLTSGFGPRRDPLRRRYSQHNGIDFAAPTGTPIFSTAEGVVTFSGRQRGYGIVVKIRHAFGFETVYAHLNKSRVKVGQRIERGDRIADMGSTGRSTGSHLHYEIRIDGKPVNPNKFIRAARNVL